MKKTGDAGPEEGGTFDYPLLTSIGAAARLTHRAFAVELQEHLAAYDIPVGMWYFLRALWEEDGLTQRQLSQRSGAMDPTAVEQLRNMEKRGLVMRRRSTEDKRKIHVFLTPRGRALKARLLPFAAEVNTSALAGMSEAEIAHLRDTLGRIRANLDARRAARTAEANGPKRRPGRPRRDAI